MGLDNTGQYRWYTFCGSIGDEYAPGLAVDSNNNIRIAGQSPASWLRAAGKAPLHEFTAGNDLTVLSLGYFFTYLPTMQKQ